MLKINIVISIILSFISLSAFAQLFSQDQNPLSVKWRTITAGGIKIIYPEELNSEAQRMANTLQYIYPFVGSSLGRNITSLPLVLQNRGSVSNGFVQLAPKKSEFYVTPSQNFDSQDWLNNLAVHELRHVAQFDKITGGKAHPFPEEIYFAYLGVALPIWFLEGDAVSTETSLTNAGRGRQPAWIMPYRSQLLSGKKVSYSKAYFGSDKEVIPGYYQMGYLIDSYLRKEFGKHIFDSLLTDIHKRPLRLFPFSSSLKKLTGLTGRQSFLKAQQENISAWQEQATKVNGKSYPLLNKQEKYETNYFQPVKINAYEILAIKRSKADVTGFVILKDKKEHRILNIGYQEQPWFSFKNNKIVWDEVRVDPRYKQRSYSVICTYDLEQKRYSQITYRSKYFSPSFSPDGKKIIAVHVDLSNKFELRELDATNGKVLNEFENQGNLTLQTPSYIQDGSKIVYITLNEQGKSLLMLDLHSGSSTTLIKNSLQQIGKPMFLENRLTFNAHLNGINNVYAIDTATRKISALTDSRLGAFNASEDNSSKIIFNDFSSIGLGIANADIEETDPGEDTFAFFGKAAAAQENTGNIFSNIPSEVFESKKYPALSRIFNFHSLSPDLNEQDKPGLTLKSNNILNTVDAYAGVYRSNLRKFEYNAGINFKALYPVFSLRYSNRARQAYFTSPKGVQQADWRENYYKIQAAIPLSYTKLNDTYSMNLSVATSYTQRNKTFL